LRGKKQEQNKEGNIKICIGSEKQIKKVKQVNISSDRDFEVTSRGWWLRYGRKGRIKKGGLVERRKQPITPLRKGGEPLVGDYARQSS